LGLTDRFDDAGVIPKVRDGGCHPQHRPVPPVRAPGSGLIAIRPLAIPM